MGRVAGQKTMLHPRILNRDCVFEPILRHAQCAYLRLYRIDFRPLLEGEQGTTITLPRKFIPPFVFSFTTNPPPTLLETGEKR